MFFIFCFFLHGSFLNQKNNLYTSTSDSKITQSILFQIEFSPDPAPDPAIVAGVRSSIKIIRITGRLPVIQRGGQHFFYRNILFTQRSSVDNLPVFHSCPLRTCRSLPLRWKEKKGQTYLLETPVFQEISGTVLGDIHYLLLLMLS